MNGPTTATRLWAGVAAAWLLACLTLTIVAAALSGVLAGHGWAWPTHPSSALRAVIAHPTTAATHWPPGGPIPGPPWLLWPLAAILAGCATATTIAAVRLARDLNLGNHRSPSTVDGFASRPVLRHFGPAAIRRAADQTRPTLTRGDIRNRPPTDLGIRLGRPTRPRARTTLWLSWNQMLRVIGPSDWGKTLRILVPTVRGLPGPTIAASTKPDLYELTAHARRTRGPVAVLDPQHMAADADPIRWNPIRGCEDSRTSAKRAAAFMHAALPTESAARDGNTAFFASSAEQVIACLLHAAALDNRTMRDVLTWATASGPHPEPSAILAHHPAAAPNWASRLHTHLADAPETSSGVRRNVELALDCFTHTDTLDLVCPDPADEFDIDAFLRTTGTVYVLGKPTTAGGGVAPLLTAFVEEVLDHAEEHALHRPHRRLDPPLHAVLDEAPSICPIPTLPQRAADGRGRGIWIAYAMQSWAQEKQRWGEHGSQTLFDTTAVTLICGGLKDDSLRTLESLLGTRKTPTTSKTRGPAGTTTSTTEQPEPVLPAADIRTLPAGQALILASNHPPVLAYQPGIWEHRDWPAIQAEQAQIRAAVEAARAGHHRDHLRHTAGAATTWRTRRTAALPRQESATHMDTSPRQAPVHESDRRWTT